LVLRGQRPRELQVLDIVFRHNFLVLRPAGSLVVTAIGDPVGQWGLRRAATPLRRDGERGTARCCGDEITDFVHIDLLDPFCQCSSGIPNAYSVLSWVGTYTWPSPAASAPESTNDVMADPLFQNSFPVAASST